MTTKGFAVRTAIVVALVGADIVGTFVAPARSWAQTRDGAPKNEHAFPLTIAPEPATLRRSLRFQILDRERGLPHSTVSAIVQDRTGFVWLGTEDGLARYDGQRVLTFRNDPEDPASLGASFVSELLLARDGTLWVGTDGGGVNRYLPDKMAFERFVPTHDPESLVSGSITAMSEDARGHIWIGTVGGGLAVLDPATRKVRTYSVEDGLRAGVSAVLAGDDGIVWVGTDVGLHRFDVARKSPELLFQDHEALKNVVITVLLRDREGALWIGTDGNGLARYAPKTGKLDVHKADPDSPDRLADNSITTVYQDRHGRLWVGTQKALHLLVDPAAGRFERFPPGQGASMELPGAPKDIYEDAAGVIWIGTFAGGAALLDPRSPHFRLYKGAAIAEILPHGDELFVGTTEKLCRYRGSSSLEGICYRTGFATSIRVDRSGVLWVGTWSDGLLRLDPDSKDQWTVFQHDPADAKGLGPGPVMETYEDEAGNFWVALFGGGLQRMDRKRGEFANVALPSTELYGVVEEPKRPGVLWLGTADSGLLRLDVASGEVAAFTPKPNDIESKTDNAAVAFAFDGDQAIWLATAGGGLKRLDRKTLSFKTYGRREGLPSDSIYSVMRDKSGHLWLSSLDGVARFDPKSERVHVFGTEDGLQSAEFSMGVAAQADSGLLYVGGINGFNVFAPEEIETDGYRPPMVLTGIRVLDEPYAGGSAPGLLELAYERRVVTIDFAALSFSGSSKLTFEYKVDGLNDRWIGTRSSSVSFTGLADGDYTLRLRARNRHGAESEPIRLEISVAPPLWRTWWAYTIYGAALLGVLFAVYRYQHTRMSRLRQMARLASIEKEYELTAAVQSWFLPETDSYKSSVLELVGFYRGAEKCSGDWWWYEDIGRGKLWVIVADVTGHGAGPAMLTAAVAMGLSVQAGRAREEVIERLQQVNREVLARCKGKATITMTAVVIDQRSGQVVVYNLGGLPALLMPRRGEHAVVGSSGTPLGSSENLTIGERTIQLQTGDRLVITTDGIIETKIAGGRVLGLRRFINVVREVGDVPLEGAVDHLIRQVDLARGQQPQEDDFTLCILERRG